MRCSDVRTKAEVTLVRPFRATTRPTSPVGKATCDQLDADQHDSWAGDEGREDLYIMSKRLSKAND